MSTPQNHPGNPKQLSDNLLDELSGTSDADIEHAAKEAESYTEEDENHDKRRGRAERRKTFLKIQRFLFWFLFIIICLILIIVSFGYIFLVWKWVENLLWGTPLHDAKALKEFIDNVLFSLLLIFATLFLEGVFGEKSQ